MKAIVVCLLAFSASLAAETLTYRALVTGDDIGLLEVDQRDDRITIEFDYKQNGRGPTIAEDMLIDDRGYPIDWVITGTTTFGSPVDETFQVAGNTARWRDATGDGSARFTDNPRFYIGQNASPYALALLARALLVNEHRSLAVYPGGVARIETRSTRSFEGLAGTLEVTAYEIFGLTYNPQLIMLDADQRFFAVASPSFSLVREGYTGADKALREWAESLSTNRFIEIQKQVAHQYEQPVRIRNVRLFDPETLSLTEPKDVVTYSDRVASVQPAGSLSPGDEVIIDGEGGTLVAGMYEMHGHMGQDSALLNIAAGVTSVRDMGNENTVLEGLIDRIDDGVIAGPRITRSCFIEGRSDFSASTGEIAETLDEALELVRWCASRDFHQVKLYNSMKPEWVGQVVAEAHRLGLRVSGHVPAFSTADAMIEAGFDEITHVNQLMLGWVLADDEDTRTLFRFTAMKRFPTLDLDGREISRTIEMMRQGNVAHDPTIVIHEYGMTAVNGEPAPYVREIIDHLPTNSQRSLKQEMLGTSSSEERAEYMAGFDFILEFLSKLHSEDILLLPGTDLGGSFAYHRELELFESIGLTPAEVLRRASFDMASYLGQAEDLGSIEKGKYADFFLVPGDPTADLGQLREIRMVVSGGIVYFPSEIYPAFGIRPFTEPPTVRAPDTEANVANR